LKNFYINNKKFTCFFLFVLWSLFVFSSLGCGSIQKRTVVTYESIGVTLETAKPTLIALCAGGVLDEGDCIAAREAFNQAVTAYKAMGVAAAIAVDTGDDTQYRDLAMELSELFVILNKYLAASQPQ
jgi:hypothetical protein